MAIKCVDILIDHSSRLDILEHIRIIFRNVASLWVIRREMFCPKTENYLKISEVNKWIV